MTSPRRPLRAIGTLAFAVALCVACGSASPSKELLSARKAYQRAEQSSAKDLAPDRLLEAEQALRSAESAHKDEARSPNEKTLSYVAERLAMLAIAVGGTMEARAETEDAQREYADELESAQKRAQSSLGKTQAELARKRNALEQREKELKKSKQELEQERQARLAAEAKAAEALKNLEEVAKIKKEERGLVITLSGQVLFKSGRATLLPLARRRLSQVARALLEQDEKKRIVVEGHTDSRGSARRNEELSRSRAESVRTFLIVEGVPAGRITAVGKGETEPIASNRTGEGRANNRRVEIVVK